jgi:hypothetical protein
MKAAQAAAERAAGITVMLAHDDVSQAMQEVGFITYCVQPLYEALTRVSPGLGAHCMSLIDANKRAWDAIINAASASGGSG